LKGTPVKAAAEGEVIEAGENQIYGKYIKIKHGEDIISLYAHCSDLLVSKGQNVKKARRLQSGKYGYFPGTSSSF